MGYITKAGGFGQEEHNWESLDVDISDLRGKCIYEKIMIWCDDDGSNKYDPDNDETVDEPE